MSDLQLQWRGPFTSAEANRLHAAAFGTRVCTDEEWDWVALVERHSLGWCTARKDAELVGFTNVIWDGLVHAWLQDVMVSPPQQRSGIGQAMVELAVEESRRAGCEWLHVLGQRCSLSPGCISGRIAFGRARNRAVYTHAAPSPGERRDRF